MIVPWIQRKTTLMYDITINNRLKIISIIKPFMEKWDNNNPMSVFFDVVKIIRSSHDNVIKGISVENINIENEMGQDIEISNYIIADKNINFTYNQIDDDFNLDVELENLFNSTDTANEEMQCLTNSVDKL